MDDEERNEVEDLKDTPIQSSRAYTIQSPHPLVDIPEVQPEVVENEYNFDLNQSEPQEYIPPSSVDNPGQAAFIRLDANAREECHKSLKLQESDRAVEYVLSLFGSWKESSDPIHPEPQELERLYRVALELETSIRRRPNGPKPPARPFTENTIEVIRSLYHVTQGLVHAQNDGRLTVYRGVRRQTAAELFAQTLDDPGRSYYKIEADTVLNVTPSKAPAVDIGSNVVFNFCIPKEEVMMAVDQLREGNSPYSDEYHVRGGKFILPERAVIYSPDNEDMWFPLSNLLTEALNPDRQEERFHDQIYRLVETAVDKNVHPGTESGERQLDRWVEVLRQGAIYTPKQRQLAERYVESIKEPEPESAHWLEESVEDGE